MNPNQLRSISPAKLKIILDLMEASKGKSTDSILPLFMQAQQNMQKQGLSFSSEESSLILDMLKADLSPAEARKVDRMQAFLSNLQG